MPAKTSAATKEAPGAPRVAIGVPVFNGEAVLPAALDSLLAQTFQDFEIVISDNASTDATAAICAEYAARDPRIRVVRQERNIGAVPNFNAVFHLGRAPLFKWQACDDVCDPTYLAKAVALLDSRPDAVWCHSRSSHIGPDGRLLDDPETLDVSYAERDVASPSERFAAVLLGADGCLDCYGLFRTDALRRTALYEPLYGAEKPMMAEVALLGRYAEIPETLFFARVAAAGSGNLATHEEQLAFVAGDDAKPQPLVRLRYLRAYLAAIHRAAPSRVEALRALGAVGRWMFQVSKWRGIVARALAGRGVGGGNRERVKRIEAAAAADAGGEVKA